MASLTKNDVWVRVDCDDAIADRPVAHRRLPDGGEIEEIPILAEGPKFLLAIANVEFRGRDEAAVARERLTFGPDELIGNAIGKTRVGTPGRLDHLNLVAVIGIAPDDGTETSEGIGVEGCCFRIHS